MERFSIIWPYENEKFSLKHQLIIQKIFYFHPTIKLFIYSNTLNENQFYYFIKNRNFVQIIKYNFLIDIDIELEYQLSIINGKINLDDNENVQNLVYENLGIIIDDFDIEKIIFDNFDRFYWYFMLIECQRNINLINDFEICYLYLKLRILYQNGGSVLSFDSLLNKELTNQNHAIFWNVHRRLENDFKCDLIGSHDDDHQKSDKNEWILKRFERVEKNNCLEEYLFIHFDDMNVTVKQMISILKKFYVVNPLAIASNFETIFRNSKISFKQQDENNNENFFVSVYPFGDKTDNRI